MTGNDILALAIIAVVIGAAFFAVKNWDAIVARFRGKP